MGVFTNHYAARLPAPVAVSPKGSTFQYARPEFRFRLAPEATQFEIQIRSVDTGELVYSDTHLAPARRRTGSAYDLCVWKFPYCVNQDLPSGSLFANGRYQWRVRGYSPHSFNGGDWSEGPESLDDWQEFTMDVSTDADAAYRSAWLQVDVRYYGKALDNFTGQLRVQAFETASFNDMPAAEVLVDSLGVVTIAGLNPGLYYLRAFVDQDQDYSRDIWETWGYVRATENTDWPFTPRGVEATEDGLAVMDVPVIFLQDCDTDQDGLPDSWEYLHNAGQADWLAVFGVENRPSAPDVHGTAFGAYTDSDGDGLNDFAEYYSGTHPHEVDSDGDGIPDGLDYALGFAPFEPNLLRITSHPGDALSWAWTGSVADTGVGALSAGGSSPALGRTVTYVLERATSLADPDWTGIAYSATPDALGTLAVPDEDLDSAFYRIRAILE